MSPSLASCRNPATPGPNRNDELEKHGVPYSRARSKMAIASASEPATGLSMKTGFFALRTGRACSRCGRPSTLSSRTTSTLASSSSIESTIATPYFSFSSRVKPATRFRLDGMSGLPPGYAATTRTPSSSGLGFSALSSFVNALTCEVSSPMIPAFSGDDWASPALTSIVIARHAPRLDNTTNPRIVASCTAMSSARTGGRRRPAPNATEPSSAVGRDDATPRSRFPSGSPIAGRGPAPYHVS